MRHNSHAKDTKLTDEQIRTLEKMHAGDHGILIYDTVENKHEVLFNFLKAGRSKKLVYVCSEEQPDQIRTAMKNFGLDVNLLQSGELTIKNYDEFYIRNGECDIARILDQWSEFVLESKARGLDGVRATGETSCFFKHGLMTDLLRYEYTLHRKLTMKMEAICAYDVVEMANSGYLDVIISFVRAHDQIILTGPRGVAILEPEKVEETDVREIMEITG